MKEQAGQVNQDCVFVIIIDSKPWFQNNLNFFEKKIDFPHW